MDNTAIGVNSFVGGGSRNSASGSRSFAAGHRAKAQHNGTFVWADLSDPDFASTGDGQFLIRAGGGVGINTNSPTNSLSVVGDASFSDRVEVAGKLVFGDDTPQRTAGPIVKAHIAADGEIINGVNVDVAVFNASLNRYEITISDEFYFFDEYVTVVTPLGNPTGVRKSSVSGKLIVQFEDGGTRQFQIVVYKLPNGVINSQAVAESGAPDSATVQGSRIGASLSTGPGLDDAGEGGVGDADWNALSTDLEQGASPPELGQADTDELREQLRELSASQGHNERRLLDLEAENARLRQQVAINTELAERNTDLESRLSTLEALLLEDRQVAEQSQ